MFFVFQVSSSSGSPHGEASLELFQRALDALLASSTTVEILEALDTLLVYTKNLILFPEEKKYRKIKISNIHYQERLGHLSGALDAMTAIGYVPQGEYLRLDERKMKATGNTEILKQLEQIVSAKLADVKAGWGKMPVRVASDQQFSSVQAAGSYSSIGKRHHMEDDEIIVDNYCGDAQQGYFGLYDGHGGRATVDFVVKALHMNLEQHLKRFPAESLPEAFKQSYLATDGQLRRQNILRSGTTSVTCVVRQIGAKRMLFTANVGDSRAVLCRGGKAVRLTIDHKASLPEEAKRITDAGGFIGRNKRVNGVLAISRALGDHMLKENDVVSAEPYCIAEGQRVTARQGEAVKIEQFRALKQKILTHAGKEGLASSSCSRLISRGSRECVELTLFDGRSLVCTPDHRILTKRGWKRADHLIIQQDEIIAGLQGFNEMPDEDGSESLKESSFSLDLPGSAALTMENFDSRQRALAAARLAGLLFSQGFSGPLDGPQPFIRASHDEALNMREEMKKVLPEENWGKIEKNGENPATWRFPQAAGEKLKPLIESIRNQEENPRALRREFLAALMGFSLSSLRVLSSGLEAQFDQPAMASAAFSLLTNLGIASLVNRPDSLLLSPSSLLQFHSFIGLRFSPVLSRALEISACWHRGASPCFSFEDFLNRLGARSFFSTKFVARPSLRSTPVDFYRLPVIARRSAGVRETFDLVVPATANFLVEGLVCHNCTDTELTTEDSHILLACDGVWDVMTDQEAIDFMVEKVRHYSQLHAEKLQDGTAERDEKNRKEQQKENTENQENQQGQEDGGAEHPMSHDPPLGEYPRNSNEVMRFVAKALVNEALERRSLDNVTVMIIQL